MKKNNTMALIVGLTLSTSVIASDFNCEVTINAEVVHNTSFEINEGTKVTFADSPYIKFSLKSMKDDKFELEAFDLTIPSRTYATAKIREIDDNLTYTLWTRESLVEVDCKLN